MSRAFHAEAGELLTSGNNIRSLGRGFVDES